MPGIVNDYSKMGTELVQEANLVQELLPLFEKLPPDQKTMVVNALQQGDFQSAMQAMDVRGLSPKSLMKLDWGDNKDTVSRLGELLSRQTPRQ